jgi:hypothetical protein
MGTVSFELQARGVGGVLVEMAERGFITELRCQVQDCYCPGGRGYFDPVPTKTDWIPTPDHYPLPRAHGGHLVPENVRLAHKKCNQLASGGEPGHDKQRAKAGLEREEWRQTYPTQSAAEAAWVKRRRANGFGGYVELKP